MMGTSFWSGAASEDSAVWRMVVMALIAGLGGEGGNIPRGRGGHNSQGWRELDCPLCARIRRKGRDRPNHGVSLEAADSRVPRGMIPMQDRGRRGEKVTMP